MPSPSGIRGVKIIDAWANLNPGGPADLVAHLDRFGLLMDAESKAYHHPAEHLFKTAPERMEGGEPPESIIAKYDQCGFEKGVLNVNADNPKLGLEALKRFPDRWAGCLRVDPRQGMEAVRALERFVRDHGFKACNVLGFAAQKPYNDKVYYPLYAKCVELDIPITCTVGIPGPRVPGEAQDPMALDEVCWFFPDLKVVMTHGGEPWTFTCVKLMLKWPNLFMMTSAFAPRHYPKDLIEFMNTRGADKVMFAGYYPGLPFERIVTELEALPLRDNVWPKFLRENAMRVFKL